jgi:hypothetical protein
MGNDDKPVEVVRPSGIDFIGVHQSDAEVAIIGFVLPGKVDLILELTPAVLVTLEATLASIREKMIQKRPLQ